MVDFSESEPPLPAAKLPRCGVCNAELGDLHVWHCKNRKLGNPYVCPVDVGLIDYTPKPSGVLPGLTGLKHDSDKPMLDLVDPTAISQLAAVLTFGAKKYAAHNWRGGIKQSRLIAALLRHVFAHLGGEDLDPESKLPHIAHAMCCCMFLLGLANRADLDDRYKEAK